MMSALRGKIVGGIAAQDHEERGKHLHDDVVAAQAGLSSLSAVRNKSAVEEGALCSSLYKYYWVICRTGAC